MVAFILSDVLIFDGERVLGTGYVHVSYGKIVDCAIGSPPILAALAANVPVISKPGHTVLPGFIDAHNHALRAEPTALRQALNFGVTTFFDMHNENENMIKLKQQSLAEPDLAADMKGAGIAATIENGWPVPVVTAHDKSPETAAEIALWPKLKTSEDAKAYVKENIAAGADYIKLMHESGKSLGMEFVKPSLELQTALVDAAHAAGKVVVAHALSLQDHLEMLQCGVDGMTHGFMDHPPTEEVIEAYKRTGAWINPTLTALASLLNQGQENASRFANDPRVDGLLGEGARERMCKCMAMHGEQSRVEYGYDLVNKLHKAGVNVIVGSDAAVPALGTSWGLSFHHELWLLVAKCALKPTEALRAGTGLTASLFGLKDRGRIARGMNADLVLIEGNPCEDIDATLNLRGVWRNGILARRFVGVLDMGVVPIEGAPVVAVDEVKPVETADVTVTEIPADKVVS